MIYFRFRRKTSKSGRWYLTSSYYNSAGNLHFFLFLFFFLECTRCKYSNCKPQQLGFVLHRYRIGMGEKTAADRTGSACERGIPVYVPTHGEEPAIIERAKIKGRFRLPIKRKWSKRAAPLYADRFVVILYLRLSIVLYRSVAESADRFKRAAILYICGINAKLSFTYSGQKGASEEHSKYSHRKFLCAVHRTVDRAGRNILGINTDVTWMVENKKKYIYLFWYQNLSKNDIIMYFSLQRINLILMDIFRFYFGYR